MQFVLFSKHWKHLDIDGMVARTRQIGADGLDLAVRPGFAVNPENVEAELPGAARRIREAGLALPMITTDGGFVDPDDEGAVRMAAAMQAADVPVAKLGYFRYRQGETPYWQTVDRIRRAFEGFERLAERFDVCFCYHTHSDYFGLNAAAMTHLLRDRNPERMAAYLDTGHLHYCGEPFPMAVDMVGESLKLVSLKDTFFERRNPETDELPDWRRCIVPAGHGVVPWQQVFETLHRVGYDGTLSVHCEFRADDQTTFSELQAREVAFLRNQCAEARR